ncbi:DnaJ-domain-containing protein [Lentinula raphanica]|nr:DnaJ-domain-containing protein [Lentinula raphanica]
MYRSRKVAGAYEALGLEPGVSLEVVKNTYKQAALRTHPDKNPNNPDATVEFQRIGEAYHILLNHLNTSDDGDDFDDDYENDSDFEDELAFYMFLFERFLNKRYSSRCHHHSHQRQSNSSMRSGPSYFGFFPPPRDYEPIPRESPAERSERLRYAREEQERAERRRRELREQESERERLEAEERQKKKVDAKRTKAQAQRQQAEDTARAQRQKVQKNRSAVFNAARQGNAQGVKKGIWENDVDAAGGEVKPGHEEFVKAMPKDPQETLLHIAVRKGDFDLVKWLDEHNAEVDERDSQDRTAFHVAVQSGHHDIISYLLEQYPPKDSDHAQIYAAPPSTSILSLALQSHEPEVVYMVLQPENGFANTQDISSAWTWINSSEGQKAMTKYSKGVKGNIVEKFDDIRTLISQVGGFTPPTTPVLDRKNDYVSSSKEKPQTDADERQPSRGGKGRNRRQAPSRGRGRARVV